MVNHALTVIVISASLVACAPSLMNWPDNTRITNSVGADEYVYQAPTPSSSAEELMLAEATPNNATQQAPAAQTQPLEPAGQPVNFHIVQKGDTLYSIAWGLGLDFQQLASSNNIPAPYIIFPGDKVYVTQPATAGSSYSAEFQDIALPDYPANRTAAAVDIRTPPPGNAVDPAVTLASQASPRVVTSIQQDLAEIAANPNPVPEPQPVVVKQPKEWPKPVQVPPPAPVVVTQPSPVPDIVVAPIPPPVVNYPTRSVGGLNWQWPHYGAIAKNYGANVGRRSGVEIAGAVGEPVYAVAPGKVVYSGDGLKRYGRLIIVRHSNDYFSAYAYNQDLLVKNEQNIAAGEMIAHMGANPDGRPSLLFEIRKEGKPVDALNFLPRR